MSTPTTMPPWVKDCPDLRTGVLHAAGWPGGSAGQRQLLTRKLERVRADIDRALKALADKPDPDLTALLEHIGSQVIASIATAIQLDTVATMERNTTEAIDG